MNARATYVHDRGKNLVAGLGSEARSVLRGRIHGRWLILANSCLRPVGALFSLFRRQGNHRPRTEAPYPRLALRSTGKEDVINVANLRLPRKHNTMPNVPRGRPWRTLLRSRGTERGLSRADAFDLAR